MRIVFDTWQFVRIMVRLEETRNSDEDRASLWAAWFSDWQQLDAELEHLRAVNFDHFATAMMDEEVILEPVDKAMVKTVARLAREVAGELKSTHQRVSKVARNDLDFERAGLSLLASRLDDLAGSAKG
ncbi:MAG: hypothetical protein OXC93_15505 [Rhodospirillaceae bacterium]|nr:hypothetical protein [Rhodospirillaceae bacterium]